MYADAMRPDAKNYLFTILQDLPLRIASRLRKFFLLYIYIKYYQDELQILMLYFAFNETNK